MTETSNEILLYQSADGQRVEVQLRGDTLWLALNQISELFGRDKSVISRHLRNVFKDGELERSSVVAKNATTAADGKTYQVEYFNLDAILSVGYRVNSVQGTRFRQWATGVLREHLNARRNDERFEANARELETMLQLVGKAAQSPELRLDTSRGLLDIVSRYAQTFLLLQRYDEGLLAEPTAQPGGTLPSTTEARAALVELKVSLIARGEATALFAQERGDAFDALMGNLDQSVFGEPAYPTVEAKAAHLLYFVIKNHPFNDGNKRSGAFLFVDFLNRNGRLLDAAGIPVINDIGLAALALLVAESDPAQKDTMIRLVMNMLATPGVV
jgi:prophage maintenance system killer protein